MVVGAVLTGVIGVFVAIACAATLGVDNISIDTAADAARALAPLAGSFSATLFGIGLLGAGLLAVSVLPLSTAYSVTDAVGTEAALDDSPSEAPLFYGAFVLVVVPAVALICIPGVSLVAILFLSQALNALLLLPLIWLMRRLGRDADVMGRYRVGTAGSLATAATIALIAGAIVLAVILALA